MLTKAFIVTNYEAEVSVLVWARSHGRAKTIALGQSGWFDSEDYIDLRARRIKKLDGMRDMGCCTGISPTQDDNRIMRSASFYELEGNMTECSSCGLFEWSSLPESKIDESGLCLECRQRGK